MHCVILLFFYKSAIIDKRGSMKFEDIKVNDIICNKHFHNYLPILVTKVYSRMDHLIWQLMIDRNHSNIELSKTMRLYKNNQLEKEAYDKITTLLEDKLKDPSVIEMLDQDSHDICHTGVSLICGIAKVDVHLKDNKRGHEQSWAIHKSSDHRPYFGQKDDYEWNLVSDKQIIEELSKRVEAIQLKTNNHHFSLNEDGLDIRQSYNSDFITTLSMKELAQLQDLLNKYLDRK